MSNIKKEYVIVNTREKFEALAKHIEEHSVLAYDTETTGLNTRKATVIGWSVSGKVGVGYYLPVYVWSSEKEVLVEQVIAGTNVSILSKALVQELVGKQLICHNGSYDCQVTESNYGIDLVPSIWVDTIMLVHTVEEEGAFGFGSPFGLKSIALKNQEALGLDVTSAANEEQIRLKESIKANGGSVTKVSYEIFKADLEILGEYACADTDLTLRICNFYLEKLYAQGLDKFFFEEEVMPIYREVTIPMERYGVDLDMNLLRASKIKIAQDLEKNKEIVLKSLYELEEARVWCVATALKKYPPSKKGTWVQRYVKNHDLLLPISEKSGKYSVNAKSIMALPNSPQKDFLLTGDISLISEEERVGLSMALWQEENDGELINIQSKDHLGQIVFEGLKETSLAKTSKGKPQFDMDMLEALAKKYTWAENLRVYNKLLKISSTYIDRFIDGSEDGRYYFYYKQNGTVSGRYGSDAQQLPKPKEDGEDTPLIVDYNNLVRRFIVAGKGRKVIDSDYSSLEPHCFASVTGDKNLQEIFNKGWDFYSTVAIRTERLDEDRKTYPNGVSPDTKSPIYLKHLNTPARNKAKSYSLGIAYGMSAYALKMTLGVKQSVADELVEGYLNGFPQLRDWIDASRETAKATGKITNFVGRVRHLDSLKFLYDKFGEQLMDWKYRKTLAGSYGTEFVQSMYRDYRNGLNNCLNFQLQSLAAAVVNRAALAINRKAKELGIDAIVQAQIHDQLIVNIAEEDAKMFAPIVQDIMENIIELPGVSLKAPPEIANNWSEGH